MYDIPWDYYDDCPLDPNYKSLAEKDSLKRKEIKENSNETLASDIH